MQRRFYTAWLIGIVNLLWLTGVTSQTTAASHSVQDAFLIVSPAQVALVDDIPQLVNISFVITPSTNSTGTIDAYAAFVSASVYSEWTAQVVGESTILAQLTNCENISLCGTVSLTLQPIRYGRATLVLAFRILKPSSNCSPNELVVWNSKNVKETACVVGTARRLTTLSVIHHQNVFDKIFRYSVLTFVVFLTFMMGTQLNIDEVVRILRRPLAPCLGVACQYVGMPMLAAAICQLFFLVPSLYSSGGPTITAATNVSFDGLQFQETAANLISALNDASETTRSAMLAFGLLALGCAPGGGASNTWTVLLHGDLQLSMSLTFFSTVLSFGMMPLWLFILTPLILRHLPQASIDSLLQASANNTDSQLPLILNHTNGLHATLAVDTVSAEQQLRIPYVHIVYQLFAFVVPCIIGVVVRKFFPRLAERFRIPLKCVSGFFVLFMISYGLWVHRYVFRVVIDDPRLIAFTVALPCCGYTLGYGCAFAAMRNRSQAIAVAIETGIQNMSIAVLIVKYNLQSPASDLGTVVLILVSIIGPLPLYLIFTFLLVRKRCKQHHAMLRERQSAHDALQIELESAKLTADDLVQLEQEDKLLMKEKLDVSETGKAGEEIRKY